MRSDNAALRRAWNALQRCCLLKMVDRRSKVLIALLIVAWFLDRMGR